MREFWWIACARGGRGAAALVWLLLAIALLAAIPARADDARLAQRLGSELARQVEGFVQVARAESLPTAPLVATALEGASKHVPAPRIVATLERHLASLRAARATLGRREDEAVLVAAAAALRAGVPRDSLVALRAARPNASILVPLVVVADLATRRVPPDAGGGLVTSAVRAGATDAALMRMREEIEADILGGASPQKSADLRLKSLLRSLGAGHAPASPRPGPEPRPASRRPGESL